MNKYSSHFTCEESTYICVLHIYSVLFSSKGQRDGENGPKNSSGTFWYNKDFLTIKVDNVQDVPLKNVLTERKVMDEPWRREWMLSHCAVEVYFVLLFSRRWFQGFNWEGLRRRKLTSPLRREVKHRCNRFYNVFTYVTLCKKRMPILLQLWNSHLLIFAAQRTSGSQSFRHVSPWAWRTPRWILWLG